MKIDHDQAWGMVQNVLSQLRNAFQDDDLPWSYQLFDDHSELTILSYGDSRRFLLVPEKKITSYMLINGNAVWAYPDNAEPFGSYDVYCVFYGWAQEVGAIELKSSGNKNKDDFRRAATAEYIRPYSEVEGCYLEIDYLLSEENILRLFSNQPLIPRSSR